MSKTKPVDAQRENEAELPEVAPEEAAQVAVRTSMDVDPRTGATVKLGVPERSDEEEVGDFVAWLQEKADVSNQDSMASLADMLRAASTAESVAEALKETPTVNGKDFVGVPFMALGFDIREGKFENEELPYFASIRAQHPNYPQGFIVNCGGMKVLVHMRTLERLNAFPVAMCVTGKQTRKGNVVLGLDLIEQNPR